MISALAVCDLADVGVGALKSRSKMLEVGAGGAAAAVAWG
jgi:shikimate 5-dehydrogenase